ncbi:MAG: hypothetical protein JWM98_577 [Thermoleophilia bacterium]|nr:hypothetical protein [Thermoleophilia bacterium]
MHRRFAARLRTTLVVSLVALGLVSAVAPAAALAGGSLPSARYYTWSLVTCANSDLHHSCPAWSLTPQGTWRATTIEAYGYGPAWTYGDSVYLYPSSYGPRWTWAYSREQGWVLMYDIRAFDPGSIALA